MRDRRLLIAGLVLVAAGVIGMSMTGPWGGWWGGMHHGPMTGWWGGEATRSAPVISGAPAVVVEGVDFAFEPDRLEVPANEEFYLTLVNRGALLHDLTIPDLGIQVVARPGESATVGVVAQQPGEYRMLCTVPGHTEAGMVGKFVVEG